MVLLSLVIGFQSGVISDARLTTPTDFDVSLRQITDFCAEVSSFSGVKFSVDKKVQDLKVDIFVNKRPLGETMDKVAKVLNCEWVPVEKGYRLEMDIPTANRERNFNIAEDAENRHILEIKLWACEFFANMIPGSNKQLTHNQELISSADRNAIIAPYEKAFRAALAGKKPDDISETQLKYSAISEAAGSLTHLNIGHIMIQMSKSALESFWLGEPIMAASFPGNGYKLWPSDTYVQTQGQFVNGQLVSKGQSDYFDLIHFDPMTGSLDTRIYSYYSDQGPYGKSESGLCRNGPFGGSSTSHPISLKLKKLPFFQDLLPWLKISETPAKFPQEINQNTESWPSPWFSGRRRLGEHMRWLHQATGIPVVAQADRSCLYNWISLKRPYKTASEYLKALMDENEVFCREDHGYLVARNFRFWSHRRHEAPELFWTKLALRKDAGPMDLNKYAAYALALRQDQMETGDLAYPVCEIDLSRVTRSYQMLRFYGMLTEEQRKTARKEVGLGVEDLTDTQRSEMTSLLKKVIFKDGFCSVGMAKYLFTNGFSSNLQQMRLHLMESGFREDTNYIEQLNDSGVVLRKSGTVKVQVNQVMFRFELEKNQTITQSISIDK